MDGDKALTTEAVTDDKSRRDERRCEEQKMKMFPSLYIVEVAAPKKTIH